MPRKDKDARLAYQREWYARNQQTVMRWHRRYRREKCVGVCVNCGGPTHGDSPNRVPRYCSKPACASAQRRPR